MAESKRIAVIQDCEPIRRKPYFEKLWFRFCFRAIAKVARFIPPLRRRIENSPSGMLGIISACHRKREYKEALTLAHAGLQKCQNSEDIWGHWDWWQFVCHAAYVADEHDISDEKKNIRKIVDNAPFPYEDYYPSIALSYVSRWMYEEKRYEEAIKYAEKAKIADKELGEPDFLLGWYTLFIKQGDPIDHFKEAIRKDTKYLRRITHDPALKKFPQIISSLKQPRAV